MSVEVDLKELTWYWTSLLPYVGLAPNATVSIDLSAQVPSSNAFFVIFSEPQLREHLDILQRYGPKPSSYVSCAWRASLDQPVSATFQLGAPAAEMYYFGVLQVSDSGPGLRGLSGDIAFENPGGVQLALQQLYIGTTFLFSGCLFLGTAIVLFLEAVVQRRRRTRLHTLLFGLVLSKVLVSFLIWNDYHEVASSGKASLVRKIVWMFLKQVQGIMEVVTLYLVGVGWNITRPRLRPSERAFVGFMSGLSLLLGSLEVACDTGLMDCPGESFPLTQLTLHSLCFLVVVVAANINIIVLQRHIAEAVATPDTGLLYVKFNAYRWFRGFFLFFVLIPSITSFLETHVVRWQLMWVVFLVQQVSLWVVYTAVVVLFRPGVPVLRVFDLAVVDESASEGEQPEPDPHAE
eukprot:NODE_7869_length_1543_cov_5.580508.p1 GENE.NODE_7869_length_1543_cov_5.580508~~NODE_7869_length_1543_cov_5.580508.p1  ORF type:complete len:418 (+),score=136.22 NODE_7869_length_1543_cov_5.580508:40-1254(+)